MLEAQGFSPVPRLHREISRSYALLVTWLRRRETHLAAGAAAAAQSCQGTSVAALGRLFAICRGFPRPCMLHAQGSSPVPRLHREISRSMPNTHANTALPWLHCTVVPSKALSETLACITHIKYLILVYVKPLWLSCDVVACILGA